ncbi:Elongation factor G-like protein [Platysternon megacephalum]|uniref:Elongation factor G-like protein n=1 Tax=Platysternon megacephalum TaxID=55544 RepID=A0A4D9DFY2_9SAUR|nr:Elongation factor G-like protein [Platysternon megacephalum]
MASKTNASLQVTSPEELRNVVLVGSAGSGKTTLFEHLVKARTDGYRGEKDDPERAAALTLARIRSGSVVINVLDAPGHPDYIGELRAGLRAADAALFVISATDGVDGITTALWRECSAVGMPRAIAVTKLDAGRASFDDVLAQCRASFGEGVAPSYMPLVTGGQIVGNVSLASLRCHDYSSGTCVKSDATQAQRDDVDAFRSNFIESILTEADDDALMERYLEGAELDRTELLADLNAALAHGTFFPVIPVQTHNGVGTEELLGTIEAGFPGACTRPLPSVTTPDLDDLPTPACSPDGPLLAEVVRTTSDPTPVHVRRAPRPASRRPRRR